MAHLTVSVEYGIHCLLWLAEADKPASCRDLAELQGISPSFLAKIFAKLEKAGIVTSTEGARGGYLLARDPAEISFLDMVDAIEGKKPLFDCQEVRGRCAVFGDTPPKWATNGTCSIHGVMLRAEKAMRETLASQSLADMTKAVGKKAPADFASDIAHWFDKRTESRKRKASPDNAPEVSS